MMRFTTSDGLRLAYKDEGEGKPVLCLAGLTRTMADFDYMMPHMPEGVRVIRMDYRGRGQSEWAEDYHSYNVPQEGRDALALLDHLNLERAAIIGTSRGGLIAMVLASMAKERLTGVLLNDIGPELDPGALDRILETVSFTPPARTIAEMTEVLPSLMPGFANLPEGRYAQEAAKHFVERPDGLHLTYDLRLKDALIESGSFDAKVWPLFDKLEGLPLALIRGANSDLLTRETVAEMRRRRPDMIFAEVPDRAHIPFLDEPESIDAIHRFIAALP